MKARAAALVLVLLVAASCERGRRKVTSIEHPESADELVVRIDLQGGFLPPRHRFVSVPLFSLFGDGRVITTGPQIELYPGPALPPLLETRISEQGIQKILGEAQEAGLLEGDRKYGNPRIMDAATTVFTVVARGRRNRVEAYALDLDGEDGRARAKLTRFQQRVGDLNALLSPSDLLEKQTAYEVEQVQVILLPAEEISSPDVEPQRLPWPLATPITAYGQPFLSAGAEARCAVPGGPDSPAILEALKGATEITIWQSEDREFSIWARPLLPDERGCGG